MNPLFFLWKKKSAIVGVNPGGAVRLPDGFYNVLSVSGKPGGLGFNCNTCHYHVPHSCPKSVKHCGGVAVFNPKAKIPTVRLTSPGRPMYGGKIFLDPDANSWDGTVEYVGNGPHF